MYESIRPADLLDLLAGQDEHDLRSYLASKKAADIVDAIEHLRGRQVRTVLAALDGAQKVETFTGLDIDLQLGVAERLDTQQLSDLLASMPTDDAARVLSRLGRRRREAVLAGFDRAEREAIAAHATYGPESAGAYASPRYAVLTPDMSAVDALARLKAEAHQVETIYDAYVVADDRRLVGVVALSRLLTAQPKAPVSEVMARDFVSASANEDREPAAERMRKYGLLSLPVMTEEGALVGVMTPRDADEILKDELREDADRFVALTDTAVEVPYMRQSVLAHFRRRVGWVLSLAALGLISGYILHVYEDVIAALVILALYIPTIADSGGNVGTQSSSLIVRGLALGDVRLRDTGRILAKEFAVALLLAGVLFLFALLKVLFLSNASDVPANITLLSVGLAVGIAIAIQVVVATLVGAMLPLGARLMRQDPALVSGPALTTLVDISGLFIYFQVCTLFFGLR